MEYYDLQNKLFLVTLKAVLFSNNKVLLLHSTASHSRWELPGGIVNIDESFAHGLIREVQEETTLKVEIGDPVAAWDEWRNNFRFKDGSVHNVRVVEIIYRCRHDDGTISLGDEHSEYRWVAKEQLSQLSMFPPQQDAVLQYLNIKRKNKI